eukprot:TRINITY_DN8437_c0_g1_i1.p1 TRINITY_DN8437_c0_g1~~TRINITY_DN8437_c0_g1_i1.p1  ORF type:complete len:805 (+),score=154.98 TRINITY_DN8437_c0_g1_i1:118-2532(+)
MGGALTFSCCQAHSEPAGLTVLEYPDHVKVDTHHMGERKRRGRKLLEDFVLGDILGQGAFGVVYECAEKDSVLMNYAVKMVDKVETPVADIKHEAELLKSFDHPNIVKFHAIYFERVFVCIVMSKYPGGDMIEGMHSFWKTKGKIPCPTAAPLARQMMQSIAYLHSCHIVHRDIKGDNYLMDRSDLLDPELTLVLADFGTALRGEPGARFKDSVGTKIYWPPEFFKLDYSFKVDVWAVGIITYGLFESRFPFRNEKDAKNKEATIKSSVSSEAKDWIAAVLAKVEDLRPSASVALMHPYVNSVTSPGEERPAEFGSKARRGSLGDQWKEEDMKEALCRGKDERRKELVQRLQGAAVVSHNTTNEKLKTMWQNEFTVGGNMVRKSTVGKSHPSRVKCCWLTLEQASKLSITLTGPVPSIASCANKMKAEEEEAVVKNLKEHGIDISLWGTGSAKSVSQFAEEVYSGSAQLMLDASSHKRLVRVVDIVLVRLSAGDKFLVETSEVLEDGRGRTDLNRIPACKKQPHENCWRAMARLLAEQLGLDASAVTIAAAREQFEEEEVSKNFPGVVTVYRKEIVDVSVIMHSDTRAKLGLDAGAPKPYTVKTGAIASKTFEWLSEAECKARRVKLRAPVEHHDVSALVRAPIGLQLEELEAFLRENDVEVSKFTGENKIKSLREFSDELVAGEATLQKTVEGKILRIVDVIALKLVKEKTGELLVESSEVLADGTSTVLNRLPGCKKRPDENEFVSAAHFIRKTFCLDDNSFTFLENEVAVVEDTKPDPAYPGVQTTFRKRILTAYLSEPDG